MYTDTSAKRKVKPLSSVNTTHKGKKTIIMGVEGGRGVRKKLFDLGIVPGSELEIVRGAPRSPYVVKVNDTRMMIGWGMVQKVLVY